MNFERSEIERLKALAADEWSVPSHVLPSALADQTLHESVRASALEYFARHQIKWWTSKYDERTPKMVPRPTGHLNSSQVACINHLEPARVEPALAEQVLRNIEPALNAVPVDDGFVDFEWIGAASYLGERGARTRGANVTSLDALMCGHSNGRRTLIAIEWKYLESYSDQSVAISSRGTDRVATYRPLLERVECPIRVPEIEWLFYEPYCQLMRQTLLIWQMALHHEFGADDWLHVHVVPERNVALRHSGAAPDLRGDTMEERWRSVLREPARYRLITPTELLRGVGEDEHWSADWRGWLARRYST